MLAHAATRLACAACHGHARRKGAFEDSIRATEALLDVGMKPRWQLFMTKKILPDLDGLMGLMDRMRIRERVQDLGSEFVIFIHPPGMVGEGRHIAHLSATLGDTKRVPAEIVESTQKHHDREKIWTTEAETVSRVLNAGGDLKPAWPFPPQPKLWFFVARNWDVYANMATTYPWWRLGNLKREPLPVILDRFERGRIPALAVNTPDTLRMLARRYGRPRSQIVANGIEQYWFETHCADAIP